MKCTKFILKIEIIVLMRNISMIVLYAGITSLRESILKIIHPEETNYTLPTLIIVAGSQEL